MYKLFSKTTTNLLITMLVFSSVFAALSVHAVACPELKAGDLFKIPNNTAVYLIIEKNGKLGRQAFLKADIYGSWYGEQNKKSAVTIDPECTDNYPSMGFVGHRPGSVLLKTPASPHVYLILPNNILKKLANATVAKNLYGEKWEDLISDVSDGLMAKYDIQTEALADAMPQEGMIVQKQGSNKYYFVHDGKLVLVKAKGKGKFNINAQKISADIFKKLTIAPTSAVTDTDIQADPNQQTAVPILAATESETKIEIEDEDKEDKIIEIKTDSITEETKKIAEEVKTEVKIEEEKTPEASSDIGIDTYNPQKIKTLAKAGESNQVGQNVYIVPEGASGQWLYGPQVQWAMNKSCVNGNAYPNSTGADYDHGVRVGINNAHFDMSLLFPINWPTPPPGHNAKFNAGYTFGYSQTQKGYYVAEAQCPSPIPLSKFNAQGWSIESTSDIHFDFYHPPYPYITEVKKADNSSILYAYQKAGLTTGDIRVIDTGLINVGSGSTAGETTYNDKKTLNIKSIHIAELNTKGENVTLKDTAEAIYKGYSSANNKNCVYGDALYTEKKLGSNTALQFSFIFHCTAQSLGMQGSMESHEMVNYVLKLNNGNIAMIYFFNPKDITDASDQIDAGSISNKEFRDQFISGIVDKS